MTLTDDLLKRLYKAAKSLQKDMAMVDYLTQSASNPYPSLVVLEYEDLTITIDGDKNHGRAHVHIDYKKSKHIASFAVDDGSRLVGRSTPYDRAISQWIVGNKSDLIQTYKDMRDKGEDKAIVARLKASDFDPKAK